MQEIINLSSAEGEKLLKELIHYALGKMSRLRWRGATVSKGGSLPKAYEPEDFALDAIHKALDGRRESWNRNSYPTLRDFLCSIIDSDVSKLVHSADNRRVRRENASSRLSLASKPSTEPDPAKVVVNDELQQKHREALTKMLGGDTFLEKLAECIEAGINKPSEIAEIMGIPVSEVNNGKKRLRRLILGSSLGSKG